VFLLQGLLFYFYGQLVYKSFTTLALAVLQILLYGFSSYGKFLQNGLCWYSEGCVSFCFPSNFPYIQMFSSTADIYTLAGDRTALFPPPFIEQ
jgi:hypothetical protein